MLRVCPKCGIPKPVDDYYANVKKCKVCCITATRAYYKNNMAACRKAGKARYQRNKEKQKKAALDRYYLLKAIDPLLILGQTSEQQSRRRRLRQVVDARREAQKRNAPLNDFTAAQWLEVQEAQEHRCYYCGKRSKGHLTQDHLTPLSQGGSHTLHNVIACCRSCNSRKGTHPPLIPVQPLLLTISKSRMPECGP